MELSVIIPCLNESDTIAECVQTALASIHRLGIEGEVIVADNGSSDNSPELATKAGARVVHAAQKGYGSAIMTGIAAANGTYLLIGDGDSSYDFSQTELFLTQLRSGYELVLGCRMPSGGGRIMPGAMPFLHRWVGNPMFSFLARRWFAAPIHDINCGMRALTADLSRRLDLNCSGMPFAVEMLVKTCLLGARIAEVPITLRPDGRKHHPPHLRTFRDGWDTLRLFIHLRRKRPSRGAEMALSR